MEKDKVIDLAGGVRALSELLDDITTQAIYAWVKVPPGRIYELRVKRPEWFEQQVCHAESNDAV